MVDLWKYQIRIYFNDGLAPVARSDPDSKVLRPLTDVLAKHNATMKCQFDAFADYVAEAEKNGIAGYPLYEWTKATIQDPAKKQKHLGSFALHVNGDEVYAEDLADALEADLLPLVGGALITQVSRHDTNPERNLPLPAPYRK